MASKVIVGCKLPHGIILEHPVDPSKKVAIGGLNESKVIGATHVHTEVDADFMEAWVAFHKSFPALKSGAIFIAKDRDAAEGKTRDMEKVKTGLEGMSQEAMGIKKDDGK